MDGNRRSGRSTRIVDQLVQDFFTKGQAKVWDHYMPPTRGERNSAPLKLNFDRLMGRLVNEHGLRKGDYAIEQQFIVINKRFHVKQN